MTIGEKIKTLRTEKNMTQKQLATALSVVDSTISNWEHGRRMPSLAELRRIAEICQVSLSYFEVFTPTLEQPLPDTMMYKHFQSIELKQKPIPMTRASHGLFLAGLTTLVLSFLFVDFVGLLFVLVGGFTLVWRAVLYYVKVLSVQLGTTTKTLVSNENKVYLQSTLNNEKVAALKHRLLMVSLSVLVISLLFAVGLNVLSAPYLELPTLSFLILFSVFGVALALERTRAFLGSRIVAKNIPYHERYPFFQHQSIILSWLYAFVVLVIFSAITVVYPLIEMGLGFLIVMIILGTLQALGSYGLLLVYRGYMARLRVIAITKEGQVIALED